MKASLNPIIAPKEIFLGLLFVCFNPENAVMIFIIINISDKTIKAMRKYLLMDNGGWVVSIKKLKQ